MTTDNWLQAQYSVLGSVLIEPDLAPKVIQQTRKSDFSGHCRTVYNAIVRLFQAGTPVDAVSLAHALGPEYRQLLVQLMEVTPSAANIDSYIQLCREQAKVLSVQDIARQILSAESSESIRRLMDEASALMVDRPGLRIVTMADALRSFMERHSGKVQYLSWPIRELNDRLYAESGDFIIMGGRPSTGKSAWSLQCARHWARDMKVGFFSFETRSEKLFDRMMASLTELTMDDIKRNNIPEVQWEKICAMTTDITRLNLELIPSAGMTPADIRSVTVMKRYQLIIIDYIQLVESSGANRTEEVTKISLALHSMAQSLGVTVVALSQLKRKGEDSTPDNSDLRESGQLEQDADIIMQLKLQKEEDYSGPRELYITKNKEGTTPKIVLAFDGKHQSFSKANRTGETITTLKAMARAEKNKPRKMQEGGEVPGQAGFAELEDADPNLPWQ